MSPYRDPSEQDQQRATRPLIGFASVFVAFVGAVMMYALLSEIRSCAHEPERCYDSVEIISYGKPTVCGAGARMVTTPIPGTSGTDVRIEARCVCPAQRIDINASGVHVTTQDGGV